MQYLLSMNKSDIVILLTFSDNSFQPDDVGMVKLSHDARFSQEVSPLLLCVAHFQGLDGHWDLFFRRKF